MRQMRRKWLLEGLAGKEIECTSFWWLLCGLIRCDGCLKPLFWRCLVKMDWFRKWNRGSLYTFHSSEIVHSRSAWCPIRTSNWRTPSQGCYACNEGVYELSPRPLSRDLKDWLLQSHPSTVTSRLRIEHTETPWVSSWCLIIAYMWYHINSVSINGGWWNVDCFGTGDGVDVTCQRWPFTPSGNRWPSST